MNPKFGNEVTTLLNTLLERCKEEKDCGSLLVALDDYYERVSYYTAYPKTLIKEVTGVADTKEKQFNLDSHILLMVSMKTILQSLVQPTLASLYAAFKQNNGFISLSNKDAFSSISNFCSQLSTIKYEFRKSEDNNLVIIENPKITFERYHYLSKINNYRKAQKVIYYIDERCFDSNLSHRKPTASHGVESTEYILFLMISSNGYEQCLFTTQGNAEVYKRWIENIVIAKLPQSSTVVLTNSYLHGNEKNSITKYHTKAEMMQWLRIQGVPHTNDMCKAELYQLIEKCTTRNKVSDIDRLFKSYGHEVLHLPSTFEEISPFEYLWEHVCSDEFLIQNDNVYDAKTKLYTYLTKISENIWMSFFIKSHRVEDEIFLLDKEIEDHFDQVCKLDNKYDMEASCECQFYHSLAAGDALQLK